MSIGVVSRDGLLGEALSSALKGEGGFAISGRFSSIPDAVRSLQGVGTLVILARGLDVDDWVQLGQARVSGKVKVVLIASPDSTSIGPGTADAVVEEGEGMEALYRAARRIVGEAAVLRVREPAVGPYGRRRGLTRREYDAAVLIAKGFPNRRISQVLDLREQSVKNLVSSIMRKLDCDNRTQVALKLTGHSVDDES